ncbi:hypothetical protein [Clostridium botulinum]|uniref:hypothetical protein n=1 Tax=Clostridium botulinum TaxID=1491 RepID=UPI003A80EB93
MLIIKIITTIAGKRNNGWNLNASNKFPLKRHKYALVNPQPGQGIPVELLNTHSLELKLFTSTI